MVVIQIRPAWAGTWEPVMEPLIVLDGVIAVTILVTGALEGWQLDAGREDDWSW